MKSTNLYRINLTKFSLSLLLYLNTYIIRITFKNFKLKVIYKYIITCLLSQYYIKATLQKLFL